MASLYEINQQMLECIDMETGEIIDLDKLEALEMERDTKLENIALWIKNLNAESEALKAEKLAFAARQKVAENKAENLRRYLTYCLGGAKFETTRVKVSFRKSQSVEIAEGATIPEEFLKYAEPTVDKIGLRDALKAGAQLDGISIVERQNIQIR